MKYLILIALSIFGTTAFAQQAAKNDDKEIKQVKFDLLKAPSSPASALLGFAVSDIEKPTDLSDFMLSLQSATSSYTKLPSSYAIDIAPFYLFRNKGADFSTTGKNGLQSTKFKDYLRQSFVVSLALRNPDSAFNNFKPTSTYGALGLKFSIIRPQYNTETKQKLNSIYEKQRALLMIYKIGLEEKRKSARYELLGIRNIYLLDSISHLPYLTEEEKKAHAVAMMEDTSSEFAKNELEKSELNKGFKKEIQAELAKQSKLEADLQEEAKTFTGNREGLSVDIAGGLSTEFREKRFDNSKIFNSGVWTTFGYNWANGSSILGLARYLYNPDEIFALDNLKNNIGNISTFDTGLRFVFTKNKFGGGAEALYRSILSSATVKPSWRVVANADYALSDNQKIIFSFGRNFDGTVTKNGNLVAALTVLFGIGTNR
ncbi:hypothetical protein [Pedobacter alluvionis]|uniref:Uncharacterized protein n=1 Tax=Pedobacter alluvionis TaxID=475253 RepID=A0A497YCV3_9SPHI|nr:hypothetical protein [Pedobacter alluvionis]RLJ80518.1 hypothetical protein BCL90_1300 [Pedobacter alluvionis]TFB31789.1 hypothetical protein E3V97_14510 [Pedobacter alluvionis]